LRDVLDLLTGDGDSNERFASLDGFLYHEGHVVGTIGSKIHGPTSTVNEDTNWKLLVAAAARRSDDVQGETVLAEGSRALIGGVLVKVSIRFCYKNLEVVLTPYPTQESPYFFTSRVSNVSFRLCGFWKRSWPTGGWAKGMPKNKS
jgi:hypothetical protein